MANEKFDAAQKVEHNALTGSDNNVSRISFGDVMNQPKDSLTDAFEKNNAAVALAAAKVAAIQERVAAYFGNDKNGHKEFLANHEAYYSKA